MIREYITQETLDAMASNPERRMALEVHPECPRDREPIYQYLAQNKIPFTATYSPEQLRVMKDVPTSIVGIIASRNPHSYDAQINYQDLVGLRIAELNGGLFENLSKKEAVA